MKSVVFTGLGLLLAPMAMAQSDLASCAANCIQSMQGQASALECSSGDIACLCRNPDFTYGIRDCSFESCQNDADAQQAVNYGADLCRQAGVVVTTTPAATVTQATGTSTVTASPIVSSIFSVITSGESTFTSFIGETTVIPVVSGSVSATPSPVTTSTFTTVIVSGESTITSVGETTLFGVGGVPGATSLPQTAITTVPIVSTISSDGTVFTTTVGSSTVLSSLTGSAASSVLSSQASDATEATTATATETQSATETETQGQTQTGEATSASTSTGLAAKQTAVPAAGFLAAAGLAAMLL